MSKKLKVYIIDPKIFPLAEYIGAELDLEW